MMVLYTLHLYTVICQLYLNKTGRKKRIISSLKYLYSYVPCVPLPEQVSMVGQPRSSRRVAYRWVRERDSYSVSGASSAKILISLCPWTWAEGPRQRWFVRKINNFIWQAGELWKLQYYKQTAFKNVAQQNSSLASHLYCLILCYLPLLLPFS